MSYTTRTACIFCFNTLQNTFFKEDIEFPATQYQVELEDKSPIVNVPFNVFLCNQCGTAQTKYLGDLSELYKINHADSTSTLTSKLHAVVCEMICKYSGDIKNIIEIGCSLGILSDLILKQMPDVIYYIIEPSFWGDPTNKVIVHDYYENVDDKIIDANTMVISHVFEHFYGPRDILDKIHKNSKIDNFFLIFPNLEHMMNANIPHFLHSEHTFYIDNDFLVKMMALYGFALVEQKYHEEQSVLFYFKRDNDRINCSDRGTISFKNSAYSLDNFYSNLKLNVEYLNELIGSVKDKQIYIWPAAIHTIYLCKFGLKYKKLHGMLDNSKYKIGKKMHCVDLPIYSFKEVLEKNNPNTIILLYGGYNIKEVAKQINDANNIRFVYPK